jgi:pimeloyl-ACP methyl ester carboxylesterase
VSQGFRRREIDRAGVRLSYLDNDAAGPVVVMLHGLAGTGDEFTATAELVGGPYRFILPDLREHGASTRRPADLSRAAFTSDVAALIRHVSPRRRVTLAGQSMGGHTAILAAAAYPELVEQLVVLEATVAGGTDPARIGNYSRSWPVPFASAAAALEFLGDDVLARSWAAHLEPAEGGGLVPAFDADVMEAIMMGVSEPQWARWRPVMMPVTAVFAPDGMVMHAPHAPGVSHSRRPADARRSARRHTAARPPRSSPGAAHGKARQLQAAQRPLRVRDRQPGPPRHSGRSDEMNPVPGRIAHLLLPDPAIAAQHHRGESDQASTIRQHRPVAGQAIRVSHARTIATLPAARTRQPPTPARSTLSATDLNVYNQQWQPRNGTLVNPISGKCLDDPRFNTTDGTQLEIYTCNGGANQRWKLP